MRQEYKSLELAGTRHFPLFSTISNAPPVGVASHIAGTLASFPDPVSDSICVPECSFAAQLRRCIVCASCPSLSRRQSAALFYYLFFCLRRSAKPSAAQGCGASTPAHVTSSTLLLTGQYQVAGKFEDGGLLHPVLFFP